MTNFNRSRIERAATEIVDACIRVHRELGPGLLESTYQACLTHELHNRNLKVDLEVPIPIRYRNVDIDKGYRIDMIVDDLILIENKSIQTLHPIHRAQMITYLKLSNRRLGFLINWNVYHLKDGLQRIAYHL